LLVKKAKIVGRCIFYVMDGSSGEAASAPQLEGRNQLGKVDSRENPSSSSKLAWDVTRQSGGPAKADIGGEVRSNFPNAIT